MSKGTSRIFLIAGALAAAGLVYLLAANPLDGETQGDFAQFLGRFHPVILHSPIGFVTLLVILEFCSLSKKYSHFEVAKPLVLLLSILSTLGAVISGMFLAYGEGLDSELALSHMRDGIFLALSLLALGACRLLKVDMTWLYRVVLAVCIVFLYQASHQGGSLTHGSGYLTKYMPNGMRPLFGLEKIEERKVASRDDMVVFTDLIQPLMEQNCISCHNPDKQKGELNLETYEGHLAGGEIAPAVVPGDLDESEMYFRITLPQSDEEFMPTDEKPPLSETEVALIAWWIEQGASATATVSSFADLPDSVDSYIATAFSRMMSPEELKRLEEERVELYADLTALKEELGVLIVPTEMDANEFTLVAYAVQKQFGDSELEALAPYAETFVEADLSRTQITDAAVGTLSKFGNVKALNLSRTQLSGRALGQLAELEKLESLNLYGSNIGAAHLSELAKLDQLKKLYLFQTELETDDRLDELRASLPNCEIVAIR